MFYGDGEIWPDSRGMSELEPIELVGSVIRITSYLGLEQLHGRWFI